MKGYSVAQCRLLMEAAMRREAEQVKRDLRVVAIGAAFGFGGKEGIESLDRSLKDG